MNRIAVSITAAAVVLFGLLTFFVPADALVSLLSAGIFISTALGVARWGPAAWRVYFPSDLYETPDRETRYGVLGLVLWLLSEGGKRIYQVVMIGLDRPSWVSDLYILAFLNAMTFAGLILVILATRFHGERPSRLPPAMLALLAFFGVLLSYVLPPITAKLLALGAMVLSSATHAL